MIAGRFVVVFFALSLLSLHAIARPRSVEPEPESDEAGQPCDTFPEPVKHMIYLFVK